LAAAESENPAKALPGAIKQVFWRITLFYVVGLLFVGLLVSSNDKRLLGNVDFVDAAASPFVIAAKDAGLKGYDSFINVVICVSVFSIGNAGVYGGSRTLAALAEQGYAPRGFSYIDRAGRPLFSTIFLLLCGFLAYLVMAANATTIFDWLLALSGLAALFTWGSILVAHIRFRHAWAKQGHTKEEIPFRAMFGIAGSYVSLLIIILVLIAQVCLHSLAARICFKTNHSLLVLHCSFSNRCLRRLWRTNWRCQYFLHLLSRCASRSFLLGLWIHLEERLTFHQIW